MPVSPVVAYAVGMTPAATVSGATPARTKNSTTGTPSRSRANARDTLPGLGPAVCIRDISETPGSVSCDRGNRSRPVRQDGPADGRLDRAGQLLQVRRELAHGLVHAAPGRREVLIQPEPEPAPDRHPGTVCRSGSAATWSRTLRASPSPGQVRRAATAPS